MKKVLIAIISTIYLVALVIVAFLGSQAEIVNRPTKVEAIVLKNKHLPYPGVVTPQSVDDYIVTVFERPEESEINENGKGYGKNDTNHEHLLSWNSGNKRRNYIVVIEDYRYLYDEMRGKYDINVEVLPANATDKSLLFHPIASDDQKANVKWDIGESSIQLSFEYQYQTLDDLMWIDIIIGSQDYSGVEIDIGIRWAI